MAVTSVNGKKNVRANSPVVVRGVLVPMSVYIDARDLKMHDGTTTLVNALKEIAPMRAVKIPGTEDDYVWDLGNGGYYS